MGVRSFLRGLIYFDEAAGATLSKKGGIGVTPNLILGDNNTYLGDVTGSVAGYGSSVSGGTGNNASAGGHIGGGDGNTASDSGAVVGGGAGNQATADNSTVAGGSQNQATAQSATVGGGDSNVAAGYAATVPGGSENTANGDYSMAIGAAATARHQAEFAHSNGGSAQGGFIVAFGQTTNDTPAQLTLGGVSSKIVPINDEVWGFRVRVVGRCTAASKALVTDLEFAVTNFGGTLAQLGSTEVGFSRATGSTTWTAVVYVSGDDVSVTVTGAVDETVDWSADFWYGRVG